jgi:hypothetical protein
MRMGLWTVIMLAMPGFSTASAQQSVYTPTSGAACKDAGSARFIGSRRCAGPAGYASLLLDEGNVTAVLFGRVGHERSLVDQDLQWQGAGRIFGAQVEWRLDGGVPYAAILRRWRTDGEIILEELLVARVRPEGSCLMGTIDARQKDANGAARELVETNRDFRCGVDQPRTSNRNPQYE